MHCVLIVFRLSIQSSYLEDSEAAADEDAFDTVQFFVGSDRAWRIRTFSMDEDVHVYLLGDVRPDTIAVVSASTEKTYGDVIAAKYTFETMDGIEGLKRELERSGWTPSLKESEQHGFAFWAPAGTDYKTKSTPES
jgi:hypothetical protein